MVAVANLVFLRRAREETEVVVSRRVCRSPLRGELRWERVKAGNRLQDVIL